MIIVDDMSGCSIDIMENQFHLDQKMKHSAAQVNLGTSPQHKLWQTMQN